MVERKIYQVLPQVSGTSDGLTKGDLINSRYDTKCLLLPMYRGRLSYGEELLCEDIKNSLGRKAKVEVVMDVQRPTEVLQLIKRARLLIGVPLHSLVFALMVGTPFIALSYHPKITRFLKEVRLEDFCVPIDVFGRWADGLPLPEIFSKIDEIFHNFSSICDGLIERREEFVSKEQINIAVLKHMLMEGFPK